MLTVSMWQPQPLQEGFLHLGHSTCGHQQQQRSNRQQGSGSIKAMCHQRFDLSCMVRSRSCGRCGSVTLKHMIAEVRYALTNRNTNAVRLRVLLRHQMCNVATPRTYKTYVQRCKVPIRHQRCTAEGRSLEKTRIPNTVP